MPLLSSTNLLTTHTLYTTTLAYFLLTNPSSVATAPLVRTLGAALQLPRATGSPLYKSATISHAFPSPKDPDGLAAPNAATSLAALCLFFTALSDLVSTSLPNPAFISVWGNQAPVRLAALFALEAWIYFSRPLGDVIILPLDGVASVGRGVAGWLVCDVVFSWGFVELVWMFWVFIAVREERGKLKQTKGDDDVRI